MRKIKTISYNEDKTTTQDWWKKMLSPNFNQVFGPQNKTK